MEEKAIVSAASNIDPATLNVLETYDEHLSYYTQLTEAENALSWIKADFYLHMLEKLGQAGLLELAKETRQARTTVLSYARTARAFPPDKRSPALKFAHHFHASYADAYNSKKKTFSSDERYGWIERAEDENWSSPKLHGKIRASKLERGLVVANCIRCGKVSKTIREYLFYPVGYSDRTVKVFIDDNCYLKVLGFIYGERHEEPKKS